MEYHNHGGIHVDDHQKKWIEEALGVVKEVTDALYHKKFTFFLGAGFSKNIKGMPTFKALVKERILPQYYDELVQNPDLRKRFLRIEEFRPMNCIHCFIYSFIEWHGESNWAYDIQQAVLGKETPQHSTQEYSLATYLERCLEYSPIGKEEDDFLNRVRNLHGYLKGKYDQQKMTEELTLLKDCSSGIRFEQTDCQECMSYYWSKNHHLLKEKGFLLGLLKKYMEWGKFQIKDLLEHIQGQLGKKEIARYIFENNPGFKIFNQLLQEYQQTPRQLIGDSQLTVARLAKEGLISEIITTNWDDLLELACYAVGMYIRTSDGSTFGPTGVEWNSTDDVQSFLEYKRYNNYAIAISEREEYYNSQIPPKTAFFIYKIHGSVDQIDKRLSEKAIVDDEFPVNMVITHRDLLDWRNDRWSEDLVNSILRSHDVVFSGLSGQDNVIYATIRRLIEEITLRQKNFSPPQSQKQIISINVNKELVLQNMLKLQDDRHIITKPYEISLSMEVNGHKGLDLFYRWLYVYYILRLFHLNRNSFIRKSIVWLNKESNDDHDYNFCKEKVITLLKTFDAMPSENASTLDLQLKLLDIFYDVIPRSINYTWLINRGLAMIFERIGGTNFLFTNPYFYLPVFYYLEWFTLYAVLFTELYRLLHKWKAHIQTTPDGIVVVDGVALLIVIGGKRENWGNLRKFGFGRFCCETSVLLDRCKKKFIVHVNKDQRQCLADDSYFCDFKYIQVQSLDAFAITMKALIREGDQDDER